MKILYCDETNLEHRSGDFLIYGGLMVDADRIQSLSDAVGALRTELGVPRDYKFKFNPGPEGFSHDQFINFKQRAMQLAIDHECKLLVYAVLHDIASTPDEARRFGINTVCFHFECTLIRYKTCGLVLIDRFTDDGNQIDAHLREKFTIGLKGMPHSAEMKLEHIVGYHYSAIGQSHIPSLVDVLLGSLRLALNCHTRQQSGLTATASTLLNLISPLIWREDGENSVSEIGFMLSPKDVRRSDYRQRYLNLSEYLLESNIELQQYRG